MIGIGLLFCYCFQNTTPFLNFKNFPKLFCMRLISWTCSIWVVIYIMDFWRNFDDFFREVMKGTELLAIFFSFLFVVWSCSKMNLEKSKFLASGNGHGSSRNHPFLFFLLFLPSFIPIGNVALYMHCICSAYCKCSP